MHCVAADKNQHAMYCDCRKWLMTPKIFHTTILIMEKEFSETVDPEMFER